MPDRWADRIWDYDYRPGTITKEPPPRLTALEVWLLVTFALLLTTLVVIVLWIAFFGGGV